jgi:hypothetical protein
MEDIPFWVLSSGLTYSPRLWYPFFHNTLFHAGLLEIGAVF